MPKGKFSEEQIVRWENYLKVKNDSDFKIEQYKLICEIHADLFAHPYHEPCISCSPKRIKEWREQITRIYETRLNT
jgi:hypothetical protein